MFDEDIDHEMRADFIDESLENLQGIPAALVELESKPDNLKIIEGIFRPVHSLKGNAAYFGMKRTKALTHEMESLLDALRKSKIRMNKAIVDSLLSGVDTLMVIMGYVRQEGAEPSDDGQVDALVARFQKLIEEPAQVKVDLWDDVMGRMQEWAQTPFFAKNPEKKRHEEMRSWLQELRSACYAAKTNAPFIVERKALLQLEGSALSQNVILEKAAQLLEVLKTKQKDVAQQAKIVGRLLDELLASEPAPKAESLLKDGKDEYELFMSKIGFDEMLRESMEEMAQKILALSVEDQVRGGAPNASIPVQAPSAEKVAEPMPKAEARAVVPQQPVSEPAEVADKAKTNGAADETRKEGREIARTMRVSEDSIDSFLGFVGELIALDEMFRYIHQELVSANIDLQICSSLLRVINSFSKLSDELQLSIMEIRKVSVRPMLQKAVRIARDVASGANKRVDVQVIGDEITIDRSLIETLEAPLVHLIRNATDHGIESAEQRTANQKDPTGHITLEMRETEDDIELRIQDDGKGLDYEKIRKKALDLGLLTAEQSIRNHHLVNFIFSSGFSTAEKITDVSGRGVGLDAVKRSVEDAGGSILVNSEPAKGTEFLVRLPKTVGTQILNSFVVSIDGERFVVPMEKISRSFRPEPEQIHRLPDGSVCIKHKNEIYPVVALDGIYAGDFQSLAQGLLLTIEGRGKPFGFLVDNIIGMQKVVLRNVPWIRVDKYLGAAVMGDGRVSMIVNLNLYEEMLL